MRTVEITTTYTLYKFEELSKEAKEKVREWYLNGQDSCIFTDICEEDLKILFPDSELKVEYSLGYCQGDGLNIYGKIQLDELLEKFKEQFTEKELKFFAWYFDQFGKTSFNMQSNNRYSYCICDRHDYMEEVLENLEYDNIRGIPTDTLEKFNELARNYMEKLCKEFEKDGYNFFYEIEEDELEEWCNDNDYEFTENGEFWS